MVIELEDKEDTSGSTTSVYQKSLIRVLPEGEACRYLGLWGTARGDMAETKRKVVAKTMTVTLFIVSCHFFEYATVTFF